MLFLYSLDNNNFGLYLKGTQTVTLRNIIEIRPRKNNPGSYVIKIGSSCRQQLQFDVVIIISKAVFQQLKNGCCYIILCVLPRN